MRFTLVVVLAFVYSTFGFGLEPSDFSLVEPSGGNWLTPDFSSSVGISFLSSGGQSWGTGTYIGTMSFDLHPNLTANLDLGYSLLFSGEGSDRFLGGIDLDWTPTDNLKLLFRYSGSMPADVFRGY